MCAAGTYHSLERGLLRLLNTDLARSEGAAASTNISKFFRPDVREIVLGRPEAAALGIASYLKVELFELFGRCMRGTQAIEEEFSAFGTPEDRECLDYVLHQKAGSSTKRFPNGVRDQGRHGEVLCALCA